MGTKKEAMVMPVEYVICSWGWPARKPVALFPMKCWGEYQKSRIREHKERSLPCTRWRHRPW